MSMSGEHTAIKTAFEVAGMTPEEIAEDRDLELTAVKAALMNCSSKYRKECGVEKPEEDEFNFSDEELKAVNKVIFETALSAEHPDGSPDYKTRLAAATYIRDDKKGRKDAVKHMAGNQFNILAFNQTVQQIRQQADSIRARLVKS